MKTAVKYIILTLAFMFLSSGVLVAGFLDVFDTVGYNILWLLLPMTALFCIAVTVNDRLLIPRLLLKSRFSGYCCGVFGMTYLLSLTALCLEYGMRRLLDLPMRIADYSSPWILADILGNSLLLALMLLGLAMLHLFNRWRQELTVEERLTAKLQSYIAAVKDRLNPSLIFRKLYAIISDRHTVSEEIEDKIRELSIYLREQLYELPGLPDIETPSESVTGHSRISSLLVSQRFSRLRHLIFLGILVFISCGAFFNAPDQPEFTTGRALSVLSLFSLFAIIAYINILWLYPRYMKRGNIRQYAVAVAGLLLAIVLPMILLQILTYEPNVYTKQLPLLIVIISTVGSLLTLFLFIVGVSAFLLLQNWINTGHRLTRLRAETIRQKYSYLRKQINPHFLFNVLNNIGITVYDNPDYARRLINDLISLLKYQLGDMERETTTLSEELSFISSYFALEATRRDTFYYLIETKVADMTIKIPTLLLIPFVENAVKYSVPGTGIPDVKVCFTSEKNRLTFLCINPYDINQARNRRNGGIGIDNTRRRLELLYDTDYALSCENDGKTYSVKLEIPLQ